MQCPATLYSSNKCMCGGIPLSHNAWGLGIKYWLRLYNGTNAMLLNKCYRLNVEENHQWVQNIQYILTSNGLGDIWQTHNMSLCHDDVIKWKHFPRYWPFVRGIHRSPVNPPHKGQWRRALTFSLICARINCWVHNCEAGDFRRHRAHCDVIVMAVPQGLKMRLNDQFNSGMGRRHRHVFTFCNVTCPSMLITNCLHISIKLEIQTSGSSIQDSEPIWIHYPHHVPI